ncbi:MAG: futalosine hydrolase [Candidatus Magnetomorum sp.]|nr:futalosine hydrolase [Candidatus Magnetomorum sp.]
MKSDQKRSILIVTAAVEETAPILSRLSDKKSLLIGGKQTFSGWIVDQPVTVVQSGIGIVNAVQAVTAAIENMSIKMIINTGCSGVFAASGLAIGDIGIATKETYIHTGVEMISGHSPLAQLPFPLIQTVNQSYYAEYPTDVHYTRHTHNILKQAFSLQNIQIKMIPFITVSTLTATPVSVTVLYNLYKAGMENMEGAGIAHIAIHYRIPFIEIRTASNYVGDREKKNWRLKQAFERSAQAIDILMRKWNDKNIDESLNSVYC